MLSFALAVGSVATILAIAASHAQSPPPAGNPTASGVAIECSQSALDTLDARIRNVTDKSKRDAASAEIKAANDLLRRNDFVGCLTHMANAEKALSPS
jgi:hypothetical protein